MKKRLEPSLSSPTDHRSGEFPLVDPITRNAILASGQDCDDVIRRLLQGEAPVHLPIGHFADQLERSHAFLRDGRVWSAFWLTPEYEWARERLVVYAPLPKLAETAWIGLPGHDLTGFVGHELIVQGARIVSVDRNRTGTVARLLVQFADEFIDTARG